MAPKKHPHPTQCNELTCMQVLTKKYECKGCHHAFYCSRKCEKKDWARHKPLCSAIEERYYQLEGATSLVVPNGLTVPQCHEQLTQWIHTHRSDLCVAIIHALELPRDLSRSGTHILRMRIAPSPINRANMHSHFHLIHAEVTGISAASGLGEIWAATLHHFLALRSDILAAGGAASAAICLECEPFGLQLIPFGSLESLDSVRVYCQWLHVLKVKLNGHVGYLSPTDLD
ncbi:hypothetical protein NLJ89_g10717 [Agrocybe chaxingu]|uniref:MYND-type domain-containing protein n=1 Tax=Agrocybe chaxingu TaxID=84603 RepID=A0A9W8JNB9_9AGAR|nr:hypothetical protein NLJ89_g10717 [Agrocybe chaxingu]